MKYEEFQIGQVYQTKPYTLTLKEIVDFAQKYDPHYYHVDEKKAEKTGLFNGIVASGMHTMSIINGEWVKLGVVGEDMLGGMGIDAKWINPVFPNDTISVGINVLNKKILDDQSGLITLQFTGFNQAQEIWAKVKIRIIVSRVQQLAESSSCT